jgi:hypothetical protein
MRPRLAVSATVRRTLTGSQNPCLSWAACHRVGQSARGVGSGFRRASALIRNRAGVRKGGGDHDHDHSHKADTILSFLCGRRGRRAALFAEVPTCYTHWARESEPWPCRGGCRQDDWGGWRRCRPPNQGSGGTCRAHNRERHAPGDIIRRYSFAVCMKVDSIGAWKW